MNDRRISVIFVVMVFKYKKLINLTNQTIKMISMTLDNFINDIKNDKVSKLVINMISKYDLLIDECKVLMKSYKKEVEDVNFFEKYQNLISLKIANISKKNTYEISETIYLSVVETMPKLYKNLIYKDLDEVELIKKLITLNEDFIENLKQFFVIED